MYDSTINMLVFIDDIAIYFAIKPTKYMVWTPLN